MPEDNAVLNPPIQYPLLWFIIGCAILLTLGLWFGWLFWITRKGKFKSIENLHMLPLTGLGELKAKYLQMIDECYAQYQRGETDMRGLHRGLSMAVRYFVYETKHFPAPRLTLSDFRRAPFPKLTQLIKRYYGEEFDVIQHGDPVASVEAAKEFIILWA